jgi:hypothetical protein
MSEDEQHFALLYFSISALSPMHSPTIRLYARVLRGSCPWFQEAGTMLTKERECALILAAARRDLSARGLLPVRS